MFFIVPKESNKAITITSIIKSKKHKTIKYSIGKTLIKYTNQSTIIDITPKDIAKYFLKPFDLFLLLFLFFFIYTTNKVYFHLIKKSSNVT